MGKRLRILLSALVVVAIIGFAWGLFLLPAEPVYQGKRLRVWLQGYSGTSLERFKTDDAVRHMGTNSIPTLLNLLRAHNSPLKTRFLIWASAHRFPGIHYTKPSILNEQGFMGLQALGPDAASAVPRLMEILEQNVSESSVDYTTRTLAVIGPEAKAAVPSLLRAANNTNVSDHGHTLWALGMIHTNAEEVVPVLIKASGNSSGGDQLFAVIALGKYKADAKSAVPALLKLLEDLKLPTGPANGLQIQTYLSQSELRTELQKALQQMDPETYARFATNPVHAQSNRPNLFSPPKTPF